MRLATRGSPLALHQTETVATLLRAAHPGLDVDVCVVRTRGDQDASAPLDQIGGQGVFVTEVEAAVADGRADAAVHSAKDMPSVMAPSFVLGAVPPRADPRDALVGCRLAELPAGALIATGSARRRAQLAYLRPDLVFRDLRGNMARRVAAAGVGGVTAVVVALAAMERLGWLDQVTDVLDPVDVLPQAGQGAIAVQCRADDDRTRAVLGVIDHDATHRAVRAERAVLATLGGSCTVPVGALAETVDAPGGREGGPALRVSGLVASADGHMMIRLSREGDDPEAVGTAVARALLDGGGAAIEGFDAGPVGSGRGTMTVYLVGAGPGDPGLLTRRGARLLARADVVLYDRLVSPALLDLAPARAELIDVGKRPEAALAAGAGGRGGQRQGGQDERQDEIARLLVEHGRSAGVVVRLKGGDPFLFGRGGEEVEALAAAGIPFEVVPGVTSAFAAPAVAGIPVTHRGVASSVTVVTGRVGSEGAEGAGAPDWEALARAGGTLVILMGMSTRAAIADALIAGGRSPDTPAAVITRATTAAQRIAHTTLAGLAAVDLDPPAVIVVGPVAALAHDSPSGSGGGALSGRTVVVTRTGARAGGLVDALERAGAETVELALTRQVDAADGGAALRATASVVGDYRWVVFTSVNAVDRFVAELRDARAFGPAFVAAVGGATADALRAEGIEPDLVPAEHSARGLVEAFPPVDPEGSARVLFPCADIAPDTIDRGLDQLGWEVQRVEAYRTVPAAAPEPEILARVARADALVLTATSSVHAFVALRAPDGDPVPVPGHVVCIGPTTAEAARGAGMTGVHEAWGASTEGIMAELSDHFGHAGPAAPSEPGAAGAS